MKPILIFTLVGLAVTGLPRRITAQHAFGTALTHAVLMNDRCDSEDSLLWSFSSVNSSGCRERAASIALDQIGAAAEKHYVGDGLSVSAGGNGARLRCVFQKLEGDVTRAGLWLNSTVTNTTHDRFRVMAEAVGRKADFGPRRQRETATTFTDGRATLAPKVVSVPAESGVAIPSRPQSRMLPSTGEVIVAGKVARFIRPGLTEEYTVSTDGVRQDFIIEQRPQGDGELRVALKVTGVKLEQGTSGELFLVASSGRKIAYNHLRVTDAKGRELPARMEVAGNSVLDVAVDDSGAFYPIRIDPTFSDANWIGTQLMPGANSYVYTAVTDGSGNLYIGGKFTFLGGMSANYIAKWNGSSWSVLGSGMSGALGGYFPAVYALAVSGGDLYAGGDFTAAGGTAARCIAKWNGSSWSALGSGMNNPVLALTVWDGDLYAGGRFTTAGGNTVNYIAKWNGNGWSALGQGMNDNVSALAVSGTNLYAGGSFLMAGGTAAGMIARWNGNSWSALGSGMNSPVYALAVSGRALYAGGDFRTADGTAAKRIAKWNGTNWSALGQGMDNRVLVLAASDGVLYAGGDFTAAGDKIAAFFARAAYLIAPPGGIADSILESDGTANLKFYGNPDHSFDVQRATSLNPPIPWTTLTTSAISPAPDGSFTFNDTNAPSGTACYRAVER